MSRGNFLSDEVVQPQTPPPRCRHREKQFSRPVGKPPSPSPRRSRAPSAHSAVCRLERNCCRSLIQVPGCSLLQPSAPCTFDLPQREASVSVMHLPDEGKLVRERVQQQIRLGVIQDLLPMSATRSRRSSMVDMKSVGSPPDPTVVVNSFSRHARRVPFGVPCARLTSE